MENLLIQLAKEAPNTVALLVVVAWFLRALNKQNDRYDRFESEHEEAREHSRQVIENCTRTMAQVVEVMRKCPGGKE